MAEDPEHVIRYKTQGAYVYGFTCSCGHKYECDVVPSPLTMQTQVDRKIAEHKPGQLGPCP